MNPTSMTRKGPNDFYGGEKLSDDIRFRMAVMKEWSIDVLWWVDQGEFFE